jgi:hypothetical protein
MVSSSEAFEKFSTWNNRNTSLRVTVIDRGKPEVVFHGFIDAVDSVASKIGVCSVEASIFDVLDVGQAEFSLEPSRMVVSREDVEWLIFEEE